MEKIIGKVLFVALFSLFVPLTVSAFEVMPSLTDSNERGMSFLGYFSDSKHKVVFDIETTTITETGEVYTDLNRIFKDFFLKKAVLKISLHRGLGYDIYLLGGCTRTKLEDEDYPREESGDWEGSIFGLGFKYIFFGDLMTLPQSAVSLELTKTSSPLKEYSSRSERGILDSNLDILKFQTAVVVGRRFHHFIPYVGAKAFYGWVTLKEKLPLEREEEGYMNGLSIFMGVKASIFSSISMTLEGSCFGDTSYALGLSIKI